MGDTTQTTPEPKPEPTPAVPQFVGLTITHPDGIITVSAPHPILSKLWGILGPLLVQIGTAFLTGLVVAQPEPPPAPPPAQG